MTKILAVSAIVFFCFLAGLFGKTAVARRLADWLESGLQS
jgi:hypothetical protein